ncbi:hypothetical protein WNB94_00590 [Aquabacterium sp. A3]|uniref:hypothetical protein n=1 Tax=Aquabacterium sp. A3 TaxID=3132829 RepID=UPI00311942EF
MTWTVPIVNLGPSECLAGEQLATITDGKAQYVCTLGCKYEAGFDTRGGGSYFLVNTGQACDGSETESRENPEDQPNPEADQQCQKGTCRARGEINGTPVDKCVPCNTVTTGTDKTGTTETTNENGETTTTSTAGTQSTSQTTCTGGTCTTTTTTTTTNDDGDEVTTTETTEQDKGSFCEENPNSQLCKTTAWGGACGNYSCDGDAVQCAQARAAAELLCKFDTPADSAQVATAQQAIAGTLSGSTPDVISGAVGDFNTTNPYTASCPGDIEVNVGGVATFTIPISTACPYIELIGWMLVAGATLAGARIAFT